MVQSRWPSGLNPYASGAGPFRRVSSAQALAQYEAAIPHMRKLHDELIASGARWDGQDGYTIDVKEQRS